MLHLILGETFQSDFIIMTEANKGTKKSKLPKNQNLTSPPPSKVSSKKTVNSKKPSLTSPKAATKKSKASVDATTIKTAAPTKAKNAKASPSKPEPTSALKTKTSKQIAPSTTAPAKKAKPSKSTSVKSAVASSPQNTAVNKKPGLKKDKSNSALSAKANRTPEFPWLHSYPSTLKWDIDIPAKPLWSLMEEAATNAPDKPCIDFLGKKYSYQEINQLVNQTAEGLQKLGVKKGTKVGIFMPNAPYFVIAYFAILKAGGIVVNYNPLYADHEVNYQIKDSDTEIMFTLDLKVLCDKLIPQLGTANFKKMIVCSVADSLPFPKNILFKLFKRGEIAKVPTNHTIVSFDSLTNNAGNPQLPAIDPKKDIALLQYTGGTTGSPKGAMLSHYNVYANSVQACTWFEGITYGQEKILAGLPLFHVYAMTAVMTLAIQTAAEIVMMFPRFNPLDAMKAIQKHRITFFPGVPTMYNMIANHPRVKEMDLNSLKICLSGGAPLPIKVKEDFESLTGCKLVEAYGLSETSPAATSNPVYGINKIGSIGIPFPGTQIKILSLDNPAKEMKIRENGQIAIKGPQVMLGYWNRSDETEKVFVGDFLLTGDVGYMDEDGYTFLVDRIKDLIICSGFNVYPRMVEEVIYRHHSVAEVTVIGIPDEKRGETVKAFVKLKEGAELSEEQLLNFLQGKLSPIEMPKFIEFRDELPKTMIGKLSKKELKAEERSKQKK